MKTLFLLILFHGSLQLQCGEKQITAQVGGEFLFSCEYKTNHFRYSKKYWCRGDSRTTCEILVDSDGSAKTKNTQIIDGGRRGLYVRVTNLQFDDAGVYWVGIDKIYADIMTSVKVVITEVPVSKPRLWPLHSLVDRPTCWGRPVTVRCGCTRGTAVRYTWRQSTPHKDALLHHSSDFQLHCGTADTHSEYLCIASNNISSQESDILSVQVLMPADGSCIYVIHMQGQPVYDCADRMSTTTAKTPPVTICPSTMKIPTDTINQSSQVNQTDQHLLFRAWTGVPFWYTLLRWGSLVSLLVCLCIALKCTKARHKRARRKRQVHFRQMPHLAQ